LLVFRRGLWGYSGISSKLTADDDNKNPRNEYFTVFLFDIYYYYFTVRRDCRLYRSGELYHLHRSPNTLVADRQKLDAFIRRGVCLKFHNHNDPTMAELFDELDQTLFTAVLHNDDRLLRYILPDRRNHSYRLRPKRHELTLAIRRDSRIFFQRLLFKDMY